MKIAVLWLFAGLFGLHALVLTLRASFTVGTLALWLLSALFAGLALFHRQIHTFTQAGAGFVLKVIFLLGCGVYAALFVFVALSGYQSTARGDEDAIIILGAGLHGEEVSEVLERRLQAGYVLWQQNPGAVIVVSGGQGPREAVPEALAMQRWLCARGVPQDQIITEDKSTSTQENLLFSRDLLALRGIGTDAKIVVVTNAFHIYRGVRYAQMAGFTDVRSQSASINLFAILPSYLREVFAVVDLWLFKRG